jgi:phage anti-repressor protein
MDTNKESAGQLEVITLDGEKWVIGESLRKFDRSGDDCFSTWIKQRIEALKLKDGTDYIRCEGVLFSTGAAARIIDYERQKKAPKPKRLSMAERRMERINNPVDTPPKRRGILINLFDVQGGKR